MIDPARYIRKAVIGALRNDGISAFGQQPPSSQATPYCLISIGYEQLQVKHFKHYRATISIDIYHDFREDGGRKTMDEITDSIFDILVPDNPPYLSIENFEHANCRLLSADERILRDESTTTYIKALRFESLISQP